MKDLVMISLLCIAVLASAGAAAEELTKEEKIKREADRAKEIDGYLETGKGSVGMVLKMAQQNARAKQRTEDEEKLKLAQSVPETAFLLAKYYNRSSAESFAQELNRQEESEARSLVLKQEQVKQEKSREQEQLESSFVGVVDIYLEPRELQTGQPALLRVRFEGIAVLLDRKLLRFRRVDRKESWLIDPTRIVAVRLSGTPPVRVGEP